MIVLTLRHVSSDVIMPEASGFGGEAGMVINSPSLETYEFISWHLTKAGNWKKEEEKIMLATLQAFYNKESLIIFFTKTIKSNPKRMRDFSIVVQIQLIIESLTKSSNY